MYILSICICKSAKVFPTKFSSLYIWFLLKLSVLGLECLHFALVKQNVSFASLCKACMHTNYSNCKYICLWQYPILISENIPVCFNLKTLSLLCMKTYAFSLNDMFTNYLVLFMPTTNVSTNVSTSIASFQLLPIYFSI